MAIIGYAHECLADGSDIMHFFEDDRANFHLTIQTALAEIHSKPEPSPIADRMLKVEDGWYYHR